MRLHTPMSTCAQSTSRDVERAIEHGRNVDESLTTTARRKFSIHVARDTRAFLSITSWR